MSRPMMRAARSARRALSGCTAAVTSTAWVTTGADIRGAAQRNPVARLGYRLDGTPWSARSSRASASSTTFFIALWKSAPRRGSALSFSTSFSTLWTPSPVIPAGTRRAAASILPLTTRIR